MFYFLNKNIKYLRVTNNYTQQELADKLSINKMSLVNIERSQRNTSIEVLDKLHNVFNISLDDLVYKDLEASNKD